MSESQVIPRNEILKKAKDEDDLSNMKQHADKMIRGFENFNDFSSNRAIWELVQNACDLSTQCHVLIDYSKTGISFAHNGKPFTTKSLISLIKQVSGKYGDAKDIPEVGKYGTGFLTTHAFGRKFNINGFLQAEDIWFNLNDFLIDRSPKEWQQLSAKIRDQRNAVFQIIENGNSVQQPNSPKTTFTYLPATEQEHNSISNSSRDLSNYVPLVLTINDRLQKFTIIDQIGQQTVFKRESKIRVENDKNIPLYKTTILINEDSHVYYSLKNDIDEIEIILPINKLHETIEFNNRIARLFLYYPLIGSEHFGLNFLINCNRFLPTEPRDGIHLRSNKDQVKEQEEANRNVIDKASNLIFEFLKSNIIEVSNPLLYARINFQRETETPLLNEYFKNLQSRWTKEFKSLPLLCTNNGFIEVSKGSFFAQELFENTNVFEEIYELAHLFYPNLPVKDKIVLWSNYVREWSDEHVDFITYEDLIEKIAGKELSLFKKSTLKNFYNHLVQENRIDLFSNYNILPNRNGTFKDQTSLYSEENLTADLIQIGEILIPEYIERLVHPEFKLNFSFETFNRKSFSNKVKEKLDEKNVANQICIPTTFEKADYNVAITDQPKIISFDFYSALLNYCKLSNNTSSTGRPIRLVKTICRYYGMEDQLIHLPKLYNQEENIELRASRKVVAKIFFNLLALHSETWVKSNIDLLFEIADCWEDSLKEAYNSAYIYPNQSNQLKSVLDLKRDIDLKEEILNLYDEICGDQIRERIIYSKFNCFIDEKQYIDNKHLTNQIEEAFFNTNVHDINEHKFKGQILSIIAKLNDPFYESHFPRLDDKKANIMLAVVTKESTKNDIFSIVTLKENQLQKLGSLAQDPNTLSEILKLGEEALETQQQEHANFQHKYKIGTHIENVLRTSMSQFLSNEEAIAKNIQDGQDIIIELNGEAVYYIEVKSRWDSKNPVRMSKNQTLRASEYKENYALCTVDMVQFQGANRYKVQDILEIKHLIHFNTDIGVKVEGLSEVLKQSTKLEEVRLDGDFRTHIPQKYINTGMPLDSFEEFLIKFIKNRHK